jgi:N6-adenosine-specific RNA methylase IME4
MIIKDLNTCEKQYDIILADPPWQYDFETKNKAFGSAMAHYDCMNIENICNLPINKISKKDSLLILWTTCPMLIKSIKVLNSWEFSYRTIIFSWIKINQDRSIRQGIGNYTMSNIEICLLGKKGNGIKRIRKNIPQVITAPISKHSEKPEKVREYIDLLYGSKYSKIELFARKTYDDWDSWGNELMEKE